MVPCHDSSCLTASARRFWGEDCGIFRPDVSMRHLRFQILVLLTLAFYALVPASAQTPLFLQKGATEGEQLGRHLLLTPDVNGDGLADMLTTTLAGEGAVGGFSGRIDLRSGATGSILRSFEGAQVDSQLGHSVALADVDGDGVQDLIAGEPHYEGPAGFRSGRVVAYQLASGALIWSANGMAPFERLGFSVSSMGDVNGDGRDEVIAGAPHAPVATEKAAGRVVVLDGMSGTELYVLTGSQRYEQFGREVAGLPDVTGDGVDEVAVGSPYWDGTNGEDSGRVQVLTITGTLIGTVEGAGPGARFGTSLVAAGDINLDGDDDLLVTAPFSDNAPLDCVGSITALLAPTFMTAHWITTGTEEYAAFGLDIVQAGDQNNDGIQEFLVSAPLANATGVLQSGRAVVLDGKNGLELWRVNGINPKAQLGRGIAGGQDLDGDGSNDMMIGSPFQDGHQAVMTGGAIQLFGPPLTAGMKVTGYGVGSLPEDVILFDAEGDGDLDIIVLSTGDPSVRILWNGDHGGTLSSGDFALLPQSVIAIPLGALPTALAADDLDNDGLVEIAVGTEAATVHLIESTGTMLSPAYALVGSPLQVAGSPTQGAISAAAFINLPSGPSLVVTTSGSLFGQGQVVRIKNVMTSATQHPVALPPAHYTNLLVTDLDVDGSGEVLVCGTDTNSQGILGIASGNSLNSTTTTALSLIPHSVSVLSLDADGMENDIVVSGMGFSSMTPLVLRNFSSSGYAGPLPLGALPGAMAVESWHFQGGTLGAALLGLDGNIYRLSDWASTAYTSVHQLTTGGTYVDITSADLQVMGGIGNSCDGHELVAVARATGMVRILRIGVPHRLVKYPGTGCANPTLQMTFTGKPILGDQTFAIHATGGPPSSSGYLLVHVPTGPATPVILFSGLCGLLLNGPNYILFPATLDSFGAYDVPIPVPYQNNLLCQDYSIQWVFPTMIPGDWEFSSAWMVRFGEY